MQLQTVEEVASMLRLSRSKVYELKERIGYLKIGGAVRFREDDVLRYLDECVVQSSTQTARRSAPRTRFKSRHFG